MNYQEQKEIIEKLDKERTACRNQIMAYAMFWLGKRGCEEYDSVYDIYQDAVVIAGSYSDKEINQIVIDDNLDGHEVGERVDDHFKPKPSFVVKFEMEANDLSDKQREVAEGVINKALDDLADMGVNFEYLGGTDDRIETKTVDL